VVHIIPSLSIEKSIKIEWWYMYHPMWQYTSYTHTKSWHVARKRERRWKRKCGCKMHLSKYP